MKYPPHLYAKSFLRALTDHNQDQAVHNLIALIRRNGDMARADLIIAAIERQLILGRRGRLVELRVARPMTDSRLADLKNLFTDQDYLSIKIDPTLVAGLRITINGERELDTTLIKKLSLMFPSSHHHVV